VSGIKYHIKSSTQKWERVHRFKEIDLGVVHLWKLNLDSSKDKLIVLWNILSSDEKDRANKFYFEKDRVHFVKCRASLRNLLGNYLGLKPAELQFEYTEYGKPYLSDSTLQFNVSHSNNKGLIAFSLENEIGVDIELINREIKIEELANRFFSENEANIIMSLNENIRHRSFFKCWTRKEAFIKAQGEGLNIPLDKFEMSILDTDEVKMRSIEWKNEKIDDWTLVSFDVDDDYIGALVLKNKLKKLDLFQLD